MATNARAARRRAAVRGTSAALSCHPSRRDAGAPRSAVAAVEVHASVLGRACSIQRGTGRPACLVLLSEILGPTSNVPAVQRALSARPAAQIRSALSAYIYAAQLPPLFFFLSEVWQDARLRFGGAQDAKQRLQAAIQQIVPVRNEIAHVREIPPGRLKRADVAGDQVMQMQRSGRSQRSNLPQRRNSIPKNPGNHQGKLF